MYWNCENVLQKRTYNCGWSTVVTLGKWERFEADGTGQDMHTQHSEGPSHQGADSIVQDMHNIPRDQPECRWLSYVNTQSSGRPSNQGDCGIFLKTVKEGCPIFREVWYILRHGW